MQNTQTEGIEKDDEFLLPDLVETVVEGMHAGRSGVPRQLLTDQGTQFVGQLTKQMCIKLNIEPCPTTHSPIAA